MATLGPIVITIDLPEGFGALPESVQLALVDKLKWRTVDPEPNTIQVPVVFELNGKSIQAALYTETDRMGRVINRN